MIQSFSQNIISKRPILLFGGGVYGAIAYYVITEIYHASISGVFDNKVKTVPWTDIPVMRTIEIAKYQDADILICAANAFEDLCREAEKYHKQGIKIYDLREVLNDYLQFVKGHTDKIKSSYLYGDINLNDIVMRYYFFAGENNHYQDKVIFPYCVLFITSKCTLRCKYCGALIGKYKPQLDYTADSLKRNMGELLEAVDGINELELMGGEPFLNLEFDEILNWCIKQQKIHAIKIVSNGTVIPKDSTWELLKHNKVKLVIDDYGFLSKNLNKLIITSQKHQVRYEIQKLQTWYQYVDPIIKKELSEKYLEETFQRCIFRNCLGLLNGKFYRCLFSGHMDNLGLSSEVESDYVQIEGKNWEMVELREEIKKIINKRYLKSCDYCNYCNCVEIAVAEQEG